MGTTSDAKPHRPTESTAIFHWPVARDEVPYWGTVDETHRHLRRSLRACYRTLSLLALMSIMLLAIWVLPR
jgi:hypothetical protein